MSELASPFVKQNLSQAETKFQRNYHHTNQQGFVNEEFSNKQ